MSGKGYFHSSSGVGVLPRGVMCGWEGIDGKESETLFRGGFQQAAAQSAAGLHDSSDTAAQPQ